MPSHFCGLKPQQSRLWRICRSSPSTFLLYKPLERNPPPYKRADFSEYIKVLRETREKRNSERIILEKFRRNQKKFGEGETQRNSPKGKFGKRERERRKWRKS